MAVPLSTSAASQYSFFQRTCKRLFRIAPASGACLLRLTLSGYPTIAHRSHAGDCCWCWDWHYTSNSALWLQRRVQRNASEASFAPRSLISNGFYGAKPDVATNLDGRGLLETDVRFTDLLGFCVCYLIQFGIAGTRRQNTLVSRAFHRLDTLH